MATHTKIATCSYCGARQTLQLSAREGHELACGSCGAPLHEMKWLKLPDAAGTKSGGKKVKKSKPHKAPHGRDLPLPRSQRKKKRKPTWKRVFEEAFDIIDDIID